MIFNIEIFVLAKKDFLDPMIRIMLEDKYKTKVTSLLDNGTYQLMYHLKIIMLR